MLSQRGFTGGHTAFQEVLLCESQHFQHTSLLIPYRKQTGHCHCDEDTDSDIAARRHIPLA